MITLTSLTPEEITTELDLKPFQGKQIFQWLHRRQVFDVDAMTDLSKDLRGRIKETCAPSQLAVVRATASPHSQGTRKALFRLPDGETVESVLLRDRERTTICVSTQVGCPVRCAFCATGQSGFARNLNAGEIVEQVLHLLSDEPLENRNPNIVYMGMGEPFLNYDETIRSIRLLMRPEGLGVGARRITVSTVGEVPGIQRFAKQDWQVRLSISLHAANDALRAQLVPIARKYPLNDLIAAIRAYIDTTRRQVTFEWVLMDGLNDHPKDAAELARLIRGLRASVNLIPLNPVAGLAYAPPAPEKCRAFRDVLAAKGVTCTLRKERGGDIDAACGQLRRGSSVTP